MPATENTTLDRIQKEILDVMEREKELKLLHTHNGSNSNNIDSLMFNDNHKFCNGTSKQIEHNPLTNSKAVTNGIKLTNGAALVNVPCKVTSVPSNNAISSANNTNNFRRYVPNPNTKGVMQRFLKARGKLLAVSALTSSRSDFEEPSRPNTGRGIRKGYVPVEERIKQEFQEAHQRERELQTIRKSYTNLSNFSEDYLDEKFPESMNGLRATKSMAQLYDGAGSESSEHSLDVAAATASAPGSLMKPARSLAELIDAEDDEDIVRPQSLILQFEKMIVKNKNAARA